MILQINQLIASSHKPCEQLGWLLYNRECKGLTEDEVHRLLEIVNDETLEKVYQKGSEYGFDNGFELGVSHRRR